MYELFDHTADLGLRVAAPDLATLLCDAATGLFSILVEGIPRDGPAERRTFEIRGERPDWLLLDWLHELLYAFDTERVLFSEFEMRRVSGGFDAAAVARPLDPERHRLLHEVKAITYHGLRVEETDGGWHAELIVDI